MGIAVVAFLIVFALIASGGVLLFYREQMIQRLTAVISPETKKKSSWKESLQQSGFSLTGVVEHLERVIPKSQAEIGVTQQRLIRAGYRTDSSIKLFNSVKLVTPIALAAVVFFTGLGKQNPFVLYVAALGIGYLIPDFWLGRMIKRRQSKLRRGLPDVLDLLVICIEAGLSLDQALKRTAEELMRAQPALCDELNIVVLEQRAGRPRSECWKHLAERTDVDVLRNLVTVLVQSEQFGTSVAKTLRVHSETLRTQRIQKVEEMAAKTTVKMVFPLVLFIFPSLFLVVLGPAFITMADSFKTFFK
jgi:tight adherence protein C